MECFQSKSYPKLNDNDYCQYILVYFNIIDRKQNSIFFSISKCKIKLRGNCVNKKKELKIKQALVHAGELIENRENKIIGKKIKFKEIFQSKLTEM